MDQPIAHAEAARLKLQATSAFETGDAPAALQLLTQAISLIKDEPQEEGSCRLLAQLYSNRAALHAHGGSFVQSLANANQAVRTDPSFAKGYLRQAAALSGLGRNGEALACLEAGLLSAEPKEDVSQLHAASADLRTALAVRPAKQPRSAVQPPTAPGATRTGASFTDPRLLVRHCLDLLDAAAALRGWVPGPQSQHQKLSGHKGFLGSGKTTLLRRIMASSLSQAALISTLHEPATASMTQQPSTHPVQPPTVNQPGLPATATSPAQHPSTHLTLPPIITSPPAPSVSQKLTVGVIVNDLASINIDGALLTAQGHSQPASQGHLVELSNGCICCSLKGDLLLAVAQLLSSAPQVNYLVVESTGVGQPLPIAAAFDSTDSRGRSLLDYVRVDCMVTVVDCPAFLGVLASAATPDAASTLTGSSPVDPEDCKPLAELLVEQVEFADMVLLNKCDLLQPPTVVSIEPAALNPQPTNLTQCSKLQAVQRVVQGLAPTAHLIPTVHCDCLLSEVMNTHRFDFERAQSSARWAQELLAAEKATGSVAHRPETEVYQISTTLFEARRPFHSTRLAAFLYPLLELSASAWETAPCSHNHNESHKGAHCSHGHEGAQAAVVNGAGAGHACATAEHNCQLPPQLLHQHQHAPPLSLSQHLPPPLISLPPGMLPLAAWLGAGFPSSQAPPSAPHNSSLGTDSRPDSIQGEGHAWAQEGSHAAHAAHRGPCAAGGGTGQQLQLQAALIRSKGLFWVHSHEQVALEWSTAGVAAAFRLHGEWLAGKLPRHIWPESRPGWDAEFGDRKMSLVLITQGPKASQLGSSLQEALNWCLASDEDLQAAEDNEREWNAIHLSDAQAAALWQAALHAD